MRKGYEISKILKEIEFGKQTRTAKAMFLANAMAYRVRLDLSMTVEAIIVEALVEAKKIISSVNENTPLDTAVCLELFKQAIRIRYELVTCVTDASLIKMAALSMTAGENQTPDESVLAIAMMEHANFERHQQDITAVLNCDV